MRRKNQIKVEERDGRVEGEEGLGRGHVIGGGDIIGRGDIIGGGKENVVGGGGGDVVGGGGGDVVGEGGGDVVKEGRGTLWKEGGGDIVEGRGHCGGRGCGIVALWRGKGHCGGRGWGHCGGRGHNSGRVQSSRGDGTSRAPTSVTGSIISLTVTCNGFTITPVDVGSATDQSD